MHPLGMAWGLQFSWCHDQRTQQHRKILWVLVLVGSGGLTPSRLTQSQCAVAPVGRPRCSCGKPPAACTVVGPGGHSAEREGVPLSATCHEWTFWRARKGRWRDSVSCRWARRSPLRFDMCIAVPANAAMPCRRSSSRAATRRPCWRRERYHFRASRPTGARITPIKWNTFALAKMSVSGRRSECGWFVRLGPLGCG